MSRRRGRARVLSQASQGGSFPPGVTLTEIDGGNTYYADNDLTYAANAGWDDPDFIPIMAFLEKYVNSTDAAMWSTLGLNTAMAIQGDADLTLMHNNGIFLILQAVEWLVDQGNNLFHATLQDTVVGINADDEPTTIAEISGPILNFPNAQQDGRLWYVNHTNNALRFFDLGGTDLDDVHETEYPTPNATTRHMDMVSMDHYYFAGGWDNAVPSEAGACWNLGRSMTIDELQRQCRYTDAIRWMRLGGSPTGGGQWQPIHPAPMSLYVETGSPYDDNDVESQIMRAAWIKPAVWGVIIGGGRYVKYFGKGDPGAFVETTGLIDSPEWGVAYNGESISARQAVTAANAEVVALASVINSPFAEEYCTVSPAPVVLSSSGPDSGFDFMVKYHNRGAAADNKFYIFAIPRYGFRTHNASGVDTGAESWPKTATFTIANTGATQVTVLNESRTISVTGGTTFQDSFSGPHTVHIYRVD